ncbi:EutN/CcmL family microcompartment protein [Cohnella kolymensis]|nr:EutN/CcmL family microcompartment protein [Cohnella kolymensis]
MIIGRVVGSVVSTVKERSCRARSCWSSSPAT